MNMPSHWYGHTYCGHSKSLRGCIGRWREWADSHNFQALPADPVAVSLYLVHLLVETPGLESEDFLFSNLVKKKD